eukprot:CAMPEP_0168602052 /NCGR_PEP_ID=MMETSP0420-20121227/13810_1 /TAXON_ID=498008 /ORGANISM="Pessonella sp." /LENGTH=186 /DNA_ID=CAMNT_0008640581 /DNA_START=31 /DNA_END=587 /DNA_ORIENTATION=-
MSDYASTASTNSVSSTSSWSPNAELSSLSQSPSSPREFEFLFLNNDNPTTTTTTTTTSSATTTNCHSKLLSSSPSTTNQSKRYHHRRTSSTPDYYKAPTATSSFDKSGCSSVRRKSNVADSPTPVVMNGKDKSNSARDKPKKVQSLQRTVLATIFAHLNDKELNNKVAMVSKDWQKLIQEVEQEQV